MHDQLIDALVHSSNDAADDLLLEALRVGNELEQSLLLNAVLKRKSIRGLSGVIERYAALSENLQSQVTTNISVFHHALRESGRSDDSNLRLAAMRLIALSRQGKLAYVLSENLHETDEVLSKAAVEAIVALSRWVATTERKLQKSVPSSMTRSANTAGNEAANSMEEAAADLLTSPDAESAAGGSSVSESPVDWAGVYHELMDQRPEIETAVSRALDVHRGRHSQDLLRAALLLADSPQSKTLAILQTTKHGGKSAMIRRLQQAPAAEQVDAFLLGSGHGQLRLHFGNAFSHIAEAPVLDALLRKTHWLKDHHLQTCMHQVTRGAWWQETELQREISRHDAEDACRIGEWLAVSGVGDDVQDEKMIRLLDHARGSVAGRLRLLRIAMRRKKGASVALLRKMLADTDERIMRLAAREIVRRRPADFENMLLQLMTNAPASVRRVIGWSIGQAGFEQFWQRFDRLDRPTRKQAGKAMLKLLPDAAQRLSRRLGSGPVEQRLKAMQIAHELQLTASLHAGLIALVNHPHPKIRSKAVAVLSPMASQSMDVLMEKALHDVDSRVRTNAIEVLETRTAPSFVPLLMQRAQLSHNRERANAIKALHHMKVGNVAPQLVRMLQDDHAEHRISGLWALRQIGLWKLLQEVGKLARADQNIRVRRYALGVLKSVAEMVQEAKAKAG